MGEIGIQRLEYLYDLDFIDILMIERGHNQRIYHDWSRVRWETYHLMLAFCGGKALNEAHIHSPQDLIQLPWDKLQDEMKPLTDEEISSLQDDMQKVTW